jgi:hypothetical protein
VRGVVEALRDLVGVGLVREDAALLTAADQRRVGRRDLDGDVTGATPATRRCSSPRARSMSATFVRVVVRASRSAAFRCSRAALLAWRAPWMTSPSIAFKCPLAALALLRASCSASLMWPIFSAWSAAALPAAVVMRPAA